MERWILHCDCNSFFASVEYALDPALGTAPLAVAGDPKRRHGIILAKNEAAKKFGIQTAEPVWSALQKCPTLRLVPPHYEAYEQFSRAINRIYQDYTDLVEPFSIDESFLDVSGTLHLFGCDAKTLADRIRARVREELGVTISVGVSFNKTFAKLGSDMKKPDATTYLPREAVREKIWPLPADALLYVGKASKERLERLNIHTIGALAQADPALLAQQLGKAGRSLSAAARGEDDAKVIPAGSGEPVKSVGNGRTFPRDLVTKDEVHSALLMLTEEVCARLRRADRFCKTISVSWKTPELVLRSRQGGVDPPSRQTDQLTACCMALLAAGNAMKTPLRAITVTAQNLIPPAERSEQLTFDGLDERRKKKETLEETVFSLRDAYGRTAIQRARLLQEGEKEQTERLVLPFHGPEKF